MRKLKVMEWVSLDGVFDSSTMEQWFNFYHSEDRAKYIQDMINGCEIMLYGQKTYEMLYPYWSSLKNNEMGVADKLNKGKKFVVSSTLDDAKWENSEIIKDNAIEEIRKIKRETGGYILLQGSATLLHSLLEAGEVDELQLLVNPHVMGTGLRLFPKELNCGFSLKDTKELANGVLLNTYHVLD